MAYSRVVFLTLILSVVSSFAVQVPVFLWGDLTKHSIKSNPLLKVPAEEFSSILKKELVNDPFTVIFIEETLSVEDFSRKNAEGSTTFPYLHANIGNAEYLPSVENPLRVLNKLADPEKVDHVKLTENGLSADIEPESGNFLFINLKDAREGESRADLLRRHNDFMEDMYAKLQERYNSVVAIYTAHYPSWTIPESHSRVRRQTETQSSNYVDMDNLLLYVSSIEYGDGSSIQTFTGFDKGTSVFNTTSFPQTLNSTVTIKESNVSLTLNFQKWGGYWFFQTVTLNNEEVLPATLEVNALDGFSYRCGDRITFAAVHNDTATHNITFVDMKIQPFFETTNDTKEFGDSFNCVGFFSVPIWSGLFVVFILLSITFYGIMMMMDIRTMDRFDDPKGKTITINSAE